MSCGCGKHMANGVEQSTITNMKQCLDWSIERATIIAKLRKEDMQIYKATHYALGEIYEIEPIDENRDNIVKIIKYNSTFNK